MNAEPLSCAEQRAQLIEVAAKVYFDWACVEAGEESRWNDSPRGAQARRFARSRAEVFLDFSVSIGSPAMNAEALSNEELAEIKRDLVAGDAPTGLKITARYLATIARDRELLRELVDALGECKHLSVDWPTYKRLMAVRARARQVLGIEATDE